MLALYTKSCEAVRVLEARIRKAEITISDQGKIADAKTQYYDDKLKKVTQDAKVKLAAAQVAKLKDLGGNPMTYLTKSGPSEPSKAAEAAVEAGEKVEAGADAGADPGGNGAKKANEDVAA
ncbi:hypothetical protein Hanom_Chr04g00340891 [Helianthus anomalus]